MKNNLVDLNNHLFEQLERLNDDELKDEKMNDEIKRAKAVSDIATKIIDNAKVVLDANKLVIEHGNKDVNLPDMLENKK